MGTVVEEPEPMVGVTVTVEDPDEGDDVEKIEVYRDGVVLATVKGNEFRAAEAPEPGPHYYLVKVTQKDGEVSGRGK